jgi:diguanylate cyclase (GGDEF)-like protein
MNKLRVEINGVYAKEERVRSIIFDVLKIFPDIAFLNSCIIKKSLFKTDFALFFISLDSFKEIYSAYGIELGNKYLKRVGTRLQGITSNNEILFKYVEDGFVLFKSNYQGIESLIYTAEKILNLNEESIVVDGKEIFSVISIGISTFPDDGADINTILKNATSVVYKFKMHDKGQYKFFQKSMNYELVEELKKKVELRKAIENNNFCVHYQLQIDTKNKNVCGVEALIRWNHPSIGIIPPSKFIPIAEESALIIPIGEWVFKEACMQNKKWQNEGNNPINVAINVSEIQLRENGFVQMVRDTIEETKIEPKYIHIELTETMIMTSFEASLQIINQLKNMGVKIVIDDFGSGYSSLNYLKILPIDIIKIDKSFIDDICNSKISESIIHEIVQIANEFNIDIIAEGVEEAEQLKILMKNGCNKIQGFLFAKPSQAHEIQDLSNLAIAKIVEFVN